MNEPLAKIRSILTRGLEEAESAGDFRAALDTCKLLIPLETSIEEREAAASKPSTELDGLTHAELVAHAEARAANLPQLIATLQPETTVADVSTVTPPVRPEDDCFVIGDDDTDEPPIEPPAPAPEARCEFCRGLASACETVRDDPAWLAAHFARPDIQQHLAAQKALRSRLGWNDSVVRDPITAGIRAATTMRRP